MQVSDACCPSGVGERKAKVEAALVRLRSLKCQISELRAECEALKKLGSEKQESLKCSECGKLIEQGLEVSLKDSFGNIKDYYHRDCFTKIWRSQNWRFDYSSPGFLRMDERDP
ncbi:hypothetical protein E2P30_01860 [Candidatus Bathyarchaeota archaeon]|nr:hypothetical protein E2P30_01860 [Candidatus Bathyarchaeota archaeon]